MKYFLLIFIATLTLQCSKAQKATKISSGGLFQIGITLSPNEKYYAYIDFEEDISTKHFEENVNIVKIENPTQILQHISRVKFLGFVKDSIILVLDKFNKLCTYSASSGRILKTLELTLRAGTYYDFKYKVVGENFYFVENNQIMVFNLQTQDKHSVIRPFEKHAYIEGFDVSPQNNFAIWLKSSIPATYDRDYYALYTCDLEGRKKKVVYSDTTEEKTYNPMVSYYSGFELAFSFYKKGKTVLSFYDFGKNQISKEEDFSPYRIINLSITSDGKKIFTLFDDSKIKENIDKMDYQEIMSGCAVYIAQ
jgi:hypothetical protein